MATMSWDAVTGSRCIDLTITKMSTGDRDLRLTFKDGSGEYSKTDGYIVYWQDKRGGVWRDGDTNTVSVSSLQDFYTPQNDSTEVRARVLAVSKTYRDGNNNEHTYYEENPSSYVYYKFNGNKTGLAKYSVTDLRLSIMQGTDSTLLASWTWSRGSQTDHFEYDWDYSTHVSMGNNSWIEDSSGNTQDGSTRQLQYNVPANARRVRLRIRPIAKTHIETYSGGQYNTLYWNSDWATFYWVIAGTVTPTTSRSITPVSLSIHARTDSTLYASWSNSKKYFMYYSFERKASKIWNSSSCNVLHGNLY